MKRYIVLRVVLALFIVPVFASAQIVTCGTASNNMCQLCDFIALGNRILNWIIGIMASVCAIVIAVAGFKMVTAGGDSGALSSAKSMIWNVLIGFIILLAAWLIVDTVMKMLVSSDGNVPGFGPWNAIQCVAQPVPTGATTPPPTGPIVAVPQQPPAGTGCAGSCSAIPSGIAVKSTACSGGGACTVSSQIAGNLTSLDGRLDTAGLNWQVTEAFPPTVTHQNPCHQNGTCIDAGFTAGTPATAANISTFVASASASGLRAVWEVKTQAEKDALVAGGVPTGNIQVVSAITAPHFSVYKVGN